MQHYTIKFSVIIISLLTGLGFVSFASAQSCPIDQVYSCSSAPSDADANDSEPVCTCEASDSRPNKCDRILNSVWFAAQSRVDHVIRLPICEQYWGSYLDTSANHGLEDIQEQTQPEAIETKYAVVSRSKMRRLRIKAAACSRK